MNRLSFRISKGLVKIFTAVLIVSILSAFSKEESNLNGEGKIFSEGSNWRDEATGDWFIGIFPDFVIYDSHVWKYLDKSLKNDGFSMTDGEKTLSVELGREKKGSRKIRVSGGKNVKANRICGKTLPDYPIKGGATSFIDNGYREGDSVTLRGYLHNMGNDNRIKEFSIRYMDLFKEDEKARIMLPVKVDSIGMFNIKFPIDNTQSVILRISNDMINVPVEPNESYFLFVDLESDQKIWMGKRSRLLNELAAHKAYEWPMELEGQFSSPQEFIGKLQAFSNRVNHSVDSVKKAVGNISPLWGEWSEKSALDIASFYGSQSRGLSDNDTLSEPVRQYLLENMWSSVGELPSAWNADMRDCFIRHFLEDAKIRYSLGNNNGEERSPIYEFELLQTALDSLDATPLIREIAISKLLYGIIEGTRKALPEEYEQLIYTRLSFPTARNKVVAFNDKMKQLTATQIDQIGDGRMISQDELVGIESGEELFKKVVAPFKGKFVLIDVWGTWCGPCKLALKEFDVERKALDPYDVVYMFFASTSPEESWKNVIKEYGVTGENVVHYNLPEEQEEMLEHFLGVSEYPTYRLVNRDGTLLDVMADPREGMEQLIELIVRLKGD